MNERGRSNWSKCSKGDNEIKRGDMRREDMLNERGRSNQSKCSDGDNEMKRGEMRKCCI